MKKLLTLLLTVVIASTVGTVKLHAETYEITYVGNGGETISGNTTYIQNADSDADLVSGVFTWEDANHLFYELLGWDADGDGNIDFWINGGSTVAEALNYDTDHDGKVTLTAIWSPTLTIQYANISTVEPYNDVNPNNSTVLNSESFGIAGTTGYTIQNASQNNPTYHNVFNGWWYKDGTYFTKLEDNTIYKTLFDTLTTSGASKVNAVLTLYADWTYKVIYHDGTQNRDDSIKYQRDISNIYSTDTYTPVTVNPSVVPTTRDAKIEYINTPAYPGVYDYVYIDINDSNNPAGADDTFDYDYPTGRYNGFMFSKAGTTLYLGTNYYHFFGWDTDPSLTSLNEKLFIPANEINQKEFTQTVNHLYAKYEEYQRVIYGNIGKASSKTAPDYILLSELPLDIDGTATPITGYKFIGWNNSSILSNFSSLADESVDLITSDYSNRYGKWAYRVEFVDDTYSISNGGYIPSRASSSVNRNTIYNTGSASYYTDDAHTYIFNQNNGTNSKYLYTPATTNSENGFYKKGYTIAGWENRNPNGFSVIDTNASANSFYFNATDLSALYTDVDQTARNSSYESSGGYPVTWNYFMIYAKWTPKNYTITLNDNFPADIGGRIYYVTTPSSGSVTATYDAALPEFTAPTLDGYTFDGYYTYSGEKVIDANGLLVSTVSNTYTTQTTSTSGAYVWSYDGDVTLYAHWVKNNYALYFDKNDGQVNIETAKTKILTYDTQEFGYDDGTLSGDLATVATPSRTGYSFTGYYWVSTAMNRLIYEANGNLSMNLFIHRDDHTYVSNLDDALFVNWNCGNVDDNHHHFTAWWVFANNATLKAGWSPIEYTITYNNTSGATMPSGYATTYDIEHGVTLPTPTKNGYNFLGWYTNSGLSGDPVTTIPVGSYGNKVFYAKWENATYNITLHDNGGAYADQYTAPSTYTYGYGATLPTSSNISKLGYNFVGWYAYEDFTGAKVTSISTTATGNKEFWLKWELIGYSITFNTDGGEYVDGYIVPSGYAVTSEATLPTAANITKSGYAFAGWYTNSSLTGEPVTTISSGSTGNREYWAKWIANSYTVHFNKNDDAATGEMADEPFTYDVGKNLTANAFGKVGYHFVGWATSPTGPVVYTNGQSVSNLTGVANDTVNLYAKWEANTYTVNYINDFNFHTGHDIPDATKATFVAKNFDGSSNISGTVSQVYTYDYATATYLPKSYVSTSGYEIFSLTGWHIKSWKILVGTEYVDFTNFGENGKIINLTTENNGALYLKPVWERNTYTVVFDKNGGEGTMANQEFTYDDWDDVNNQSKYVALRKNSFTNSVIGKTEFNHWSTDATDLAGVTFINGQPVLNITAEDKATVTLYAIWSDFKPVNYYFNMGDTYTANYRENGLDADGTTVKPGKDPSNHDIDSTAAPYNITNTNIKKVLTSTTDKQKELSNKLIKRTGYDFGGFYKDADLTISVSKIDDLTEPYDVYVKWVPHTYTVTYNSNLPTGTRTFGGVTGDTLSTITGTTANSNHTYDVAGALTNNGYELEGYSFAGWAETSTGDVVRADGADHGNLTTLDNITVTLFAKWTANNYSLVYDANKPATASSEVQGTTTEAALSRTYDVGSNLTANGYSLVGWTFLGWSTNKNATVPEFIDGEEVINLNTGGHTTAEENTTTLYAVWAANTYTVDYVENKPQTDNDVTNMPVDVIWTYDVTYHTPVEAENPKLTNYTFAGWNTKADGSGTPYLTNVEIKNLTPVDGATFKLYAQWTLDNNVSTTFDSSVINALGLPADTVFYVDGVKTALNIDGGLTVPAGAKVLTTYTYAEMGSITYTDEEGHDHVLNAGELDQKPATMKVFFVTENGLALDDKGNDFDNIFIYNGTQVRLSGNRGIRFRTAIDKTTYDALMGNGYEGYKVIEFGLLAAWKSATADPIYTDPQVKKAINYQIGTAPKNVKEVENDPSKMYFEVGMVGNYSDEQMKSEFATRPYMILRPVGATDSSQDIYLYGATIYRTISHESLYWINVKNQDGTYRYNSSNGYNYLNSTIVGPDRNWIRTYPQVQ